MTGGGHTPPPRGLTTFTGFVWRAVTEGTNKGDAAKLSGTVLYDDKGRLSVREADLEPVENNPELKEVIIKPLEKLKTSANKYNLL